VAPRVIHEDSSHGYGGDAEELCSPLPSTARLVDEPEVRLVDECGGRQRVTSALTPQLSMREAP
jgi:hypothetical protein